MLDFIVGAAIIALPPQIQIPLAVGISVRGVVQSLRRKNHAKRIASSIVISEEVELQWSQLSCTLTEKDGNERILLDKLNGSAKSGRLLAICGPSGSGKTTLLNALAGQLPYSKKMRLEGYITAAGHAIPAPGIRAGFVAQEDVFFSQMTVRETLSMTAELRNSSSSTPEEREAHVEAVIRRLGLAKCADTAVGDAKTRGLSGGEKKRLSIACELVSRPQLILADEPTSGLDAFAAQQVMQALKDLAEDGHTIVTTIHQPRSSIFAMFDDLCLMSEGRLIYFGPAQDAVPHFAALGYPCPTAWNPAEFLADLVAIDHSSPEAETESQERVEGLADAWEKTSAPPEAPLVAEDQLGAAEAAAAVTEIRPACGLRRQVALLLQRSWRQVTRDRATLAARASSQVSSAAVFSAIYYRMGKTQPAIQDRLGLLQVGAVGTAMTAMIKTLNVFPKERTVVVRERTRSAYPVLPYLLAKLAAELPIGAVFPAIFGAIVYPATGLNPKPVRFARYLTILMAESFSAQALGMAVGAAAPSTEAALAIGPAVILVSIVFGGLFINESSVPLPLRWLPRTSLIKHTFEGACINEFEGEFYEADERGRGDTTGEEVLKRLAFQNDNVNATLAHQGKIMAFYWWCCFCILQAKRPRYLPLLPPPKQTEEKA